MDKCKCSQFKYIYLLYIFISQLFLTWTDWFAAGKGPDPVKKSLDDEMDEYFKGKIAKANTESA